MKYNFDYFKRYLQKKSAKMFNLYQHMKTNSEGKEGQKEPEYTGHDRFYQERPRTSYRKKKRRGACRRAQSAAELNPESIAAANRRNAFKIRSVSTDREESEGNDTIFLRSLYPTAEQWPPPNHPTVLYLHYLFVANRVDIYSGHRTIVKAYRAVSVCPIFIILLNGFS